MLKKNFKFYLFNEYALESLFEKKNIIILLFTLKQIHLFFY